MKIVIIQGAFLPVPPVIGGAVEKMWFLLAKEFVDLGHDVVYLSRSYKGMPDFEVIDGVRHLRKGGYQMPNSGIYLKILDFFYTLKLMSSVPLDADIVVTNTFFAPILLPKKIQDRAYVDVARMPKGQIKLYSKAARLRANSTPVTLAIRSELPEDQNGRVVMIPNPLPFVADKTAPPFQEKSGMLYCGRIHPEKGIQLLIDSLRLMDNPPSLRVIGPWKIEQGGAGPTFYQSLQHSAHGLPVTFLEPIFSIDELNAEYRNAAIFAYPSLAEKGETFGLAPLESMAWGCIPVVSNLSCFKDFIVNGQNGVSFDHRGADAAQLLANAIEGIMADAIQAERMSNSATNVRLSHSSRSVAEEFLADFKRVISSIDT